MTFTLHLPLHLGRKLREMGTACGQAPAEFALALLDHSLAAVAAETEADDVLLAAAVDRMPHRSAQDQKGRPGTCRGVPPTWEAARARGVGSGHVGGKWPGEETDGWPGPSRI
jgi:hypothetical protein